MFSSIKKTIKPSTSKNRRGLVYRTKNSLIFGFSAVIGLMAFLVAFRYYELETTKKHIDLIAKNHLTKIDLVVQMRSAAHERTLALQRMLLQTDPFNRDAEWLRFNQHGAEFARARLNILSMNLTDTEKKLLDYQGDVTKKALDAQKRVVELLEKDKFNQARDVMLASVIPSKEQVINQLNTFYHYQEKEAEKIARDASKLYEELSSLVVIVSIVACTLGIAIATYVIRRAATTEQALSNAYNNIQKQSEEKSQFLADVIDEYRLPLNSLMEHSDAIARNFHEDIHNNKELLSDIAEIRNACYHLNGLTTEIMDLTKVESGKVAISTLDLDICEFVNDVANQIKPIAAKNNNHIDVICPPHIGHLETDPAKLRQILFNLLANACKYTEYGLITLSVKSETTRNNGTGYRRWINFSVTDTGIGIAQDKVKDIFSIKTKFYQSRHSFREDTGLSLSISRRMAHMLGGEILVNSQPGIGSVFSIKLPYGVTRPTEPVM